MRTIGAIFNFLLSRGDLLSPSLWSLIAGIVRGLFKGFLEARDEPDRVKFYSTTAGRRNDVWLAWDTQRVLRTLDGADSAQDADDTDGVGK